MNDETVMQEVQSKPGYYAILPAGVRYDKRLAPMERILYAEITALAQRDGSCWAKTSYFCELYEVAESTVYRWLSNLQKCGYISTEPMRNKGMIVGRRISLISQPAPYSQKSEDVLSKMRGPSSQKQEDYNRKNNKNINNTPLPPKGECDATSHSEKLFETFWAAYPKKADKKKARRAWAKLKHLDKLFPQLMKALEAQKQSEQWNRNGGNYIPLPSTWLNGERWADDLTTGASAPVQPDNGAGYGYQEVHRAL